MKIILCAVSQDLVNAWQQTLHDDEIEIIHDDITRLTVDAVVSPANSFGFMDGGVDLAYSRAFGWHVQQRLQDKIRNLPCGELLVGQALYVPTDDEKIPWLIAAPTMRVPSRILDTTAIYLAVRAAMRTALALNIGSIAFPGMGTGCGCVPVQIAARFMLAGIKAGFQPEPFPTSLRQIVERGIIP